MKHYVWMTCDYLVHGQPTIYLFARDESGNRKVFSTVYTPYFYAPADEVGSDTTFQALDGTKVAKVEVRLPHDVPVESKRFSRVYEDKIPFPLRWLIDKGIKAGFIEDNGTLKPAENLMVPLRKMYLDVEVETRGQVPNPRTAPNPILCFTVGYENETLISWKAYNWQQERDILIGLVNWLKREQPDVIIGWNPFFDLATIANRMKKHKIPISLLSPLNYAEVREHSVKISGINVFDLYLAFKKFFQGRTFESYQLDYIAETFLGMKERFDKKDEMTTDHMDEIVRYNRRDVLKIIRLDRKFRLTDTYDGIRRVAGCRLEDALFTNMYTDIAMLHEYHGHYVLGTRYSTREKQSYVGAYVHKPYKGVFDWVIALDFASMYPSIIVSHNISPETMTQDTSDVFVIDDVNFKKKPLGIVPKLIQRFLNHRKSIKQQMQNVDKMSEEYKMLNLIDYALKQMIASVYGTFAFTGSRLYYPAVAKSITFLGRKYTKDVIAYIERTGKKVLYGDTDSILVQVGPNVIEEGKRLETQINDWLKTQGATPEIEFEIAYRKLLFSGAKKRYAGRCIYYKGKKTDELIVKGFESKRSDSALNSRECQDTLLRLILWGRTEKEIRDYIKSVAQNITSQSLQEIGIPQPLRQHPEMYANQASILGVIYANKILNYGFGIDDRPLIVWIKSVPSHLPKRIQLATKDKSGKRRLKWYDVNRVALRDERDFQFWKSHIDWKVQREKILEMKIEKILSSYGISFSEIMNGHKQKTLEDFNSLCSGQ